MRPSWLEVENAMIFLISFWVRAHRAVNRVVVAPKHRISDWVILFDSRSG